MVELSPGITVNPSVRFGKPVIKGTRVPADTIVARVASGMNIKDIAEEYGITGQDIYNALRYAAIRLAIVEVGKVRLRG